MRVPRRRAGPRHTRVPTARGAAAPRRGPIRRGHHETAPRACRNGAAALEPGQPGVGERPLEARRSFRRADAGPHQPHLDELAHRRRQDRIRRAALRHEPDGGAIARRGAAEPAVRELAPARRATPAASSSSLAVGAEEGPELSTADDETDLIQDPPAVVLQGQPFGGHQCLTAPRVAVLRRGRGGLHDGSDSRNAGDRVDAAMLQRGCPSSSRKKYAATGAA